MDSELRKAPGALSKPEPSGVEMLELGTYLRTYRKFYKLTQRQAAKLLGLKYRRIQIYEAASKWNAENQGRLRAYPGIFDFSVTSGVARQGWSNQASLARALDRIIAGEVPRKRHRRKVASPARLDPDLADVQDRLRQAYQTKVVIDEMGVTFHHYGNKELLQALIEKLLVK